MEINPLLAYSKSCSNALHGLGLLRGNNTLRAESLFISRVTRLAHFDIINLAAWRSKFLRQSGHSVNFFESCPIQFCASSFSFSVRPWCGCRAGGRWPGSAPWRRRRWSAPSCTTSWWGRRKTKQSDRGYAAVNSRRKWKLWLGLSLELDCICRVIVSREGSPKIQYFLGENILFNSLKTSFHTFWC